jgi:hypothetical protein
MAIHPDEFNKYFLASIVSPAKQELATSAGPLPSPYS